MDCLGEGRVGDSAGVSAAAGPGRAERFAAGARFAGMLAILVPLDSVEIEAAVGEVADGALGALRADRGSRERVVELQRALHTIKGGARMAGLLSIGDFAHEMEELLERIADRLEAAFVQVRVVGVDPNHPTLQH